MNPYLAEYLKYLLWGSFRTPRGLLLRALYLVLLFGIVHFAGLREYTTFLFGTPAGPESFRLKLLLGSIYILTYLGAAIIAPILVLAAAILKLWRRFTGWPHNQS